MRPQNTAMLLLMANKKSLTKTLQIIEQRFTTTHNVDACDISRLQRHNDHICFMCAYRLVCAFLFDRITFCWLTVMHVNVYFGAQNSIFDAFGADFLHTKTQRNVTSEVN